MKTVGGSLLCTGLAGVEIHSSPSSAGWQEYMSVTFWIRLLWYQFQSGLWHKCFCANPLVTRLVFGLKLFLGCLQCLHSSSFSFFWTSRKLWLNHLPNYFPIYHRAYQNYVLILKPVWDLQVCVNVLCRAVLHFWQALWKWFAASRYEEQHKEKLMVVRSCLSRWSGLRL